MHSRRLFIAASLALFAGCSDKATGPTGLQGTMTFNYSGALSGTFSVTGAIPTSQTAMETTPWATGEIVSGGVDAGTYVIAAGPRTASTHDFVFIQANRTNPGTSVIDFDNCPGVSSICSTVFIYFGYQNGTGATILQDCYLQTGSIVITEVTATRVRGTFSGAGLCFSQGGTQTAFTITNGSFDVALVPGVS